MHLKSKLLGSTLLSVNLLVIFAFLFSMESEELYQKTQLPETLCTSKSSLLIYFGYVGCPTICPSSLTEISSAIKGINKEKMDIVFVNLTNSTTREVQRFTTNFDATIRGVQLKPKQLKKLKRDLNVFYSKEQKTINRIGGHSSDLYYLEKNKIGEWFLKGILTSPLKSEIIKRIYNLKKPIRCLDYCLQIAFLYRMKRKSGLRCMPV